MKEKITVPRLLQDEQVREELDTVLWMITPPETGINSIIQSAKWTNPEKFPSSESVSIALELCPLYRTGTELLTSEFVTSLKTENDILTSRVGNKWLATKHAISALSVFLNRHNKKLAVHATFADIGVLIRKERGYERDILHQQNDAYHHLLRKFCDAEKIGLTFGNLSNVSPLDTNRIVPEFIVTNSGMLVNTNQDEKHMWDTISQELHLNMEQKAIGTPKRKALIHLLQTMDGNIHVFRDFVNTYTNYQTTRTSDIHLGMERSPSILKLHTIFPESHITTIPSLNILVS